MAVSMKKETMFVCLFVSLLTMELLIEKKFLLHKWFWKFHSSVDKGHISFQLCWICVAITAAVLPQQEPMSLFLEYTQFSTSVILGPKKCGWYYFQTNWWLCGTKEHSELNYSKTMSCVIRNDGYMTLRICQNPQNVQHRRNLNVNYGL